MVELINFLSGRIEMKIGLLFGGLLSVCSISASQQKATNYLYNATDRDLFYEDRGRGPIPHTRTNIKPHEKIIFKRTGEGETCLIYYVSKRGERLGNYFDPSSFYQNFPDGFVIIAELNDSREKPLKVRAVSSEEFDKEYAKALKETQKKFTPEIQAGTGLIPGVCGIVSEYTVEKP